MREPLWSFMARLVKCSSVTFLLFPRTNECTRVVDSEWICFILLTHRLHLEYKMTIKWFSLIEGNWGGGEIYQIICMFSFPQNVDEGIAYGQELVANNAGWIYIPPFDDPLIWWDGFSWHPRSCDCVYISLLLLWHLSYHAWTEQLQGVNEMMWQDVCYHSYSGGGCQITNLFEMSHSKC